MGSENAPQGHSFTVDSSFVADMPEVLAMRWALMQREKAFVFPYEMLQNAIDYHAYSDDPTDLPYVLCVLPDGRSVLSTELTGETPSPVRIEFHNKIAGSEGLSPYQIADIAHTAESATLGKHGRGGTVAATAALTDQHISSIDYSSRAKNVQDQIYAWRGKGKMKIMDPVHQKAPRFVVEYEYTPNDVTETVVGIDNPDQSIVEALKGIPTSFLPANPRYEGCKLKGSEIAPKSANLMVIQIGESVDGQSFTEEETRRMLCESPETVQKSSHKVEILPDDLVGRNAGAKTVEFMYEGGLKLRTWGWDARYALNWSFYGFGDPSVTARYGYNPSRSKDSVTIDGSAKDLIAVTLKHCENPTIFSRILENCVEVKEDEVCTEAGIDQSIFSNLPANTSQALVLAWRKIAQERNFPEDVLITQDESIKRRLEAEGRKAVVVSSKAFCQVLVKALGLQDATQALGIKEVIKETGENMRYTRRNLEEHKHGAVSALTKFMSESNGTINVQQGKIVAELAAAGSFRGRYADLPLTLRGFVEDYLSAGGSLNIKIADSIFEIEMKGPLREGAEVAMSIKKGTSVSRSNDLTIQLLAPSPQEERVRTSLLSELSEKLGKYIKKDGSIDWEAYKATSVASLEDVERQIAEKQRRLRALAHSEIRKNESSFTQRLSQRTRDTLLWSNIARLSTMSLVVGALIFGGGEVLTQLNKMGVEVPRIELPSNTVDLAGFKVKLPVRESATQSSGGLVMPRYEDRLPDRISLAELRGLRPLAYADILQLPKGEFSGQNGEAIGYFPIEQFVGGKPMALQGQPLEPFGNAYRVNLFEETQLVPGGDDILVYKPKIVYQSLYPPSGWEIISTYQVGGKVPMMNKEKALFWQDAKDMPSEVVVMVKPVPRETLNDTSGRVQSLGRISPFGEYNPKFDMTKAMEINDQLRNDPKLQTLHKNFLQEMIVWQISENKDRTQAANIVTKYLTLFAQYSNTRAYGLDFQINKKSTGFDSIVSVAEDPQAKYFCSVASNVTKELLESAGVKIANQPGNTLYNINGTLFSYISHQNNVVYLPDGTLYLVDNTPYVLPGDMPFGSPDSQPSVGAPVSPVPDQRIERIKQNLQKQSDHYLPPQLLKPEEVTEKVSEWDGIGKVATETGLPIAALALAYFALKRVTPTLRQREIRSRMERSVKENRLTGIEFLLVSAIEDHLVNGSEQSSGDIEQVSGRYLDLALKFNLREHGPALQWLAEAPEGIKTIVGDSGIVSPQEAFANVASGYVTPSTGVADRFPPSLRSSFLRMNEGQDSLKDMSGNERTEALKQAHIEIPQDFQTLYDLAVLIHTRGKGDVATVQNRTDIMDRVIQTKLLQGEIGPSKFNVLNALYLQLTGKRLRESFSQSREESVTK
ncbi:hypothetical protein HYU93_03800 [Candidatus Daviesbacteria bacterium]|nr:hypothetical protein [Candidatus Daviesbacteria bacterium]